MKNVLTDLGANNLVADGTTSGGTDNTAAINAAMAAWTPANGAWFFPAGQYNFNSTPNAVPNGMVWYGEGMNLTTLFGYRTSASATAVLNLASTQNVTLRHLQVSTLDTANAAQQCLDCSGSTNLSCERVKVSNGFSAGLRAASKANFLRFVDGEVTNFHQSTSASGFSGDFSNSVIKGTYFHNELAPYVNQQHAIYINGSANPSNTLIQNCMFTRWPSGAMIDLAGDEAGTPTGTARNLRVDSCSFSHGGLTATPIASEFVTIRGVIGAAVTNCSMDLDGNNGSFYGTSAIQVFGENSSDFLISGNVITVTSPNFGGSAIALGNAGGYVGGGRICDNVFALPNGYTNNMTGIFAPIGLDGLEICDNTFTGATVGVWLAGANATAPQFNNVSIHNNTFKQAISPIFGTSGFTTGLGANVAVGVLIDGNVSGISIVDNRCLNFNYELAFTTGNGSKFVTTGNASNVTYKVTTGTVGYAGGAAPTSLTRIIPNPALAMPSVTPGTAYTTLVG